jgi:polysaccharide biosynthesis protein PslH
MRVLLIADAVPYPPVNGALLRSYQLARRIARRNELWLAALTDSPSESDLQPDVEAHLREFCRGIVVAPRDRHTPLGHLPGLAGYALRGKPLELKFDYSQRLADEIRALTSRIAFDIVQIEHSHMAPYIEAVSPTSDAKHVLSFVDVEFDLYRRLFDVEKRPIARLRAGLHSLLMRRWEPAYAERFDQCVAVSSSDRQLLRAVNPHLRPEVVPNGVDTVALRPLPFDGAARGLVYVGRMSYLPCADGATYFCNEILPLIKRRGVEVETWIVGADPPPEVTALAGRDIRVTGRVADVTPYYQKSLVSIVPLRAGSGTRLKILEAMALGRPVVSTTIGCAGLDVVDGEHLLIADTAAEFAEATTRLLADRSLREQIAANARDLVVQRYDWDGIAEHLMRIHAGLTALGTAKGFARAFVGPD